MVSRASLVFGLMYAGRAVWHKQDYKLITYDNARTFQLYDLEKDPSETSDLAAQRPETVEQLKKELSAWHGSVQNSFEGAEYGTASLERSGKQWRKRRSPRKCQRRSRGGQRRRSRGPVCPEPNGCRCRRVAGGWHRPPDARRIYVRGLLAVPHWLRISPAASPVVCRAPSGLHSCWSPQT